MPDGGTFIGGQTFPALVLNADFCPLFSYLPSPIWSWQEMQSPALPARLPSVIAPKECIPTARRPAFTRFNLFLRDRFECQYCGEGRPTHDPTFNRVVPRSLGGLTIWANICRAFHMVFVSDQRLRSNISKLVGRYGQMKRAQPTWARRWA